MTRFQTKPLEQVAVLFSGGTPRKSDDGLWRGDVPWLTPKDMGNWTGTTEKTVSASAIGNGTRLAPENACYVAVRGMSLHNEIRIARSSRSLTFNQDIKAIAPIDGVDHTFFYYSLVAQKQKLLEWVTSAGHGTGVLETDRLKSLPIPVMPIREQSRIADVFASLDNKIELNRRMSETLEAMAQAIFREWFVDFGPTRRKLEGASDPVAILGGLVQDADRARALADLFPAALGDDGLPEGWRVGKIEEFMEIFDNRRVPLSARERERRAGPFPYHGATSVMGYVDDFLFDETLLLVGEDGSVEQPNGKPFTQYVWGKIWVNNHAHVLKGKYISTEQLKIVFDHVDIAPFVTGAVQAKLNQANMKKIPLVVANREIHDAFDEFLPVLFGRIRSGVEQNRTLAATRDLLLPKLMSGEIRLSEAEDLVEAAQ